MAEVQDALATGEVSIQQPGAEVSMPTVTWPGGQRKSPAATIGAGRRIEPAMATDGKRILFLCTHNSARSQMAEALLRELGGDRFAVYSAGTEATKIQPLAITAMVELGIDISGQESKTLERYLQEPFDKVITVCDDANESCPVFFGARERLHWSFPDPSKATGTQEERIERELLTDR